MRTRGTDLALIGVAAAWGASYLAAKIATDVAPVAMVLEVRYGVALLACTALLAFRHGWRITGRELGVGAVLGLTQAAVLALETWGVAGTTASRAGVLISLTIMITPGFEATLGGPRVPAAFYLAGGVCVLGVALLLGPAGWSSPRPGDLLMLAAAVVRGGHVALVGRLAPTGKVRVMPLTTVQLVVGTLVFAPLGLRGNLPPVTSGFWVATIYLALVGSVFAFIVQTWAVQRTSASRSSLLLGTEPLWAVAVAALLGGEVFGLLAGVGAALIVGGTYAGQVVEDRHRLGRSRTRRTPTPV